MTPSVRSFFSKLDAMLPEGSSGVLDLPDTMLVLHTDAALRPTRVVAYTGLPAVGAHTLVNVGQDWVFGKKYWFRKRANHTFASPGQLKYELLVSYTEAYRPEFEVDLTHPLFSLALRPR